MSACEGDGAEGAAQDAWVTAGSWAEANVDLAHRVTWARFSLACRFYCMQRGSRKV